MLWLLITAVVCIIFYYKAIKPLSYWKDRGIANKTPYPLIGNFGPVLFQRRAFFDYVQDLYKEFSKERYYGVNQFGRPALYIKDIELIKKITVKDFDKFTDHSDFVATELDPLVKRNLFNLKGQRWRDMRATLSPSFTSSKMKLMFTLVSECADDLTRYFQKQEDLHEIEMKDIFTRITNDVIASTAFGVKCNSFDDKTNEFYLNAKKSSNIVGIGFVTFIIHLIFPKIAQLFKLRITPTSVGDFFRRIVQESIELREKEGLIRPDMIHLLMEARRGQNVQEEDNLPETGFAAVKESLRPHKRSINLSDEDITSQALIFVFGGFETTSSLMCFATYELAVNPDIQERLQKEIDETFSDCNEKLTYEALHKMKYMDMVISETLRKWTPGFQTDRVCVQDYIIEPVHPWEKPLLIEKGTLMLLPIIAIHHDSKYYPNPEVFDPERFNDENRHNINPFTYMPFGSGPRSCIASRFALMENKTILFHMLRKYDIVCIKRTPIPLKIAKATITFVAEGGFWLGLKKKTAV